MCMNRLEENFDTVSAFVLSLGQSLHECLAHRPIAAETLLDIIGTDQDHILNCDAPEFWPSNTWVPLDVDEYGFNDHDTMIVECENVGNIEEPKNKQSKESENIQNAPEEAENVKCDESENVHGEEFANLRAEESEKSP